MITGLNRVCLVGTAADVDILTSVCFILGAQGVEVRDHQTHSAIDKDQVWVLAWHGGDQNPEQLRYAYQEYCSVPISIRIQFEPVDTWRDTLDESNPVYIGEKFVVGGLDTDSSRRTRLHLMSGLGFGSGHHETTQLCIESMEMVFEREPSMRRVADIGTGSGILSIVAAHLGALDVVGTDIDTVALQSAKAHVDENGFTGRIDIRSTLGHDERAFDLVVSNLYLPELLEMIPALARHTRAGGYTIVSGFTLSHADSVRARLLEFGLMEIRRRIQEPWTAIIAYRAS